MCLLSISFDNRLIAVRSPRLAQDVVFRVIIECVLAPRSPLFVGEVVSTQLEPRPYDVYLGSGQFTSVRTPLQHLSSRLAVRFGKTIISKRDVCNLPPKQCTIFHSLLVSDECFLFSVHKPFQ